jgi:hypothetical protein
VYFSRLIIYIGIFFDNFSISGGISLDKKLRCSRRDG